MNKGAKGGLQRHHLKDECQYVVSGKLLIRYDDGDGLIEKTLHAGQSVHIPPGCVHQEEALTDVVLFEISSPHGNDRVRMEEEYGMQIPEGGLPTTKLEEVEVL